jgi:hypothetical protein
LRLKRLTGLRVERRAEGVALIDTAGWAEHRFPGTGVAAQTALLLASEIADRITDMDAPELTRCPARTSADRRRELVALLDSALPLSGVLDDAPQHLVEQQAMDGDAVTHPFLPNTWLRSIVEGILDRYAVAFGEKWLADPDRLLSEALAVLTHNRLVP